MSTEFRQRIRKSLANETLQIALDANAERRVTGRISAFASLPDWEERRQRAHALRADVIKHLDKYLNQFAQNAEQNGINVHHAKDADEAIKIVLGIAKSSPQRYRENQKENFAPLSELRGKKILVAKSKSMVTEEVNLNHALEANGMKVVETDLGEYIVQLRNEKPSHIITPAVHLRRQDVGQLFHEKLDVPYTEDIPTMTNTARKLLREVFLTADVGISGVNFGVADTGGICLVTNEGNGRMVTSLPPIHIALMGIERLVRNLDDLALMLSLLPRSATGQKLSVYTQLIHKPLSHQQRHIILIDNGRTKLRNSPLKESLLCIRCGACMNACPVFREIGGHAYNSVYPGPIGSVISAGLFGSEFVPLAQASSLCGACKDACPVDIDLPKMLTRVRAGQSETKKGKKKDNGLSWTSKLFLRIYSRLTTHPRLFAISQKFASLGTSLISPFSDYVRLPAITGWGYSKDLPKFAKNTFRNQWSVFRQDHITQNEPKNLPLISKDSLVAPLPQSDINQTKQFIEELTKVDGQIIRTTENDLTSKVIDFLKSRDINRIHLEASVLDEDVLQKAGITVRHERDEKIPVGVTKAICGLADTGSVLEADDDGHKLYASLLPEIHLAILHKPDIYPSLENAIHLTRETKSAVFITGPSRTGDIEMSHTIGVHGPGEVVVFLVP
ncbi:MAG TPA: LUD domain-containing protein [Anaerolineales bacterium]|nr:LUD domain-containing protein [Anaerolineales bacterium]